MAYKYFGRLAGLTSAVDALTTSAPPNTTTPFNPQAPATKFMAYGENATSGAFNRAFGALSANIDSLKGVFDAPALRREVLSPRRVSTDHSDSDETGFTVLGRYGASNTEGIQSGGDGTEINLGAQDQPPTWVYLGLHESEISSFIRLYKVSHDPSLHGGSDIDGDRADISNRLTVSPSSAIVGSGAASNSYFPEIPGYEGDDLQSLPMFIPAISAIASDAQPYGGTALTLNVHTWETDGITLSPSGHSFSDLCLRPGCYLKIMGHGSGGVLNGLTNDGLYQIASIRHSQDGDKAVLSRGNLIKVTVADKVPYSAGQLVAWRPPPEHASGDASLKTAAAPNYAHIVHIIDRPDVPPPAGGDEPCDLYLAVVGASDDFAGSKASTDDFQKFGRRLYGNVGLPDKEEGAASNWSLIVGTEVWARDGAWTASTVLNVVPPSAPIHFHQDLIHGFARPCSPLGFLLGPTLTFTDDNEIVKGDYYCYCSTLTTVGEQLRGNAASAIRGSYEDPSAEMVINYGDMRSITDFARHVRAGYEQWEPAAAGLESPYASGFGPTRLTLGNDIYYMELEYDSGGAPGASFEADYPGLVGTQITTEHNGTNHEAVGTVVGVSGNYLLLKNVQLVESGHPTLSTFRGDQQLIVDLVSGNLGGNGYKNLLPLGGGVIYRVKRLISSNTSFGGPFGGPLEEFTPTAGLNAVYNNDYAADPSLRGQYGTGNEILYAEQDRPITVIFDFTDVDQTLFKLHSDADPTKSIRLIDAFGRALDTLLLGRISLEWGRSSYDRRIAAAPATEQRPLTFFDENTNAWGWKSDFNMLENNCGIPLTSHDTHETWVTTAKDDDQIGYTYGFKTNYDEPRAFDYRGMPKEINTFSAGDNRQPSMMEALEALKLGSYAPGEADRVGKIDAAGKGQAANNFGTFSNGLIKGGWVSWWRKDRDQWNTDYNYAGSGAVVDNDHKIDIGEAWFLKGGVKVYQPETRLSLDNIATGEACSNGDHILFFHFDSAENSGDNYVGRYRVVHLGDLNNSDMTAFPNSGMEIWDNPWTIPICLLTYDLSIDRITKVIDCRQRISREDSRGNIYVGTHGAAGEAFPATTDVGDYPNQVTHFGSIGEALAAIGCWDRLRSKCRDNEVDRYWTIEVISHTFEWPFDLPSTEYDQTEAEKRGLGYPYRIPVDGLTIIGRAPSGDNPHYTGDDALIIWGNPNIGTGPSNGDGWTDAAGSPEQNLIDLNGKSGLVFRNLSFSWLGADTVAMQNIALNRDIAYDYADPDTWYANMPGCNLFINRTATPEDYEVGGDLEDGDRPSSFYVAENATAQLDLRSATSRDILIENVHLHGGSGFLFHVDYPNFDNLTIRNCSASHVSNTFVTIESVSADPLDGAQATNPGFHRNVLIENCTATSHDNVTGPNSIEWKFSNAIHLTGCPDFKVKNCTITGFLSGVCARNQNWWYTKEYWVSGIVANLPTSMSGDMPGAGGLIGVDAVQPSFGVVTGCTFGYQYQRGILWHCVEETSPDLGGAWGGITITDCTFKDWATDRVVQSALYKDVWVPQDTVGLIPAPAIETVGPDTVVKGNKFIRREHGPNWDNISWDVRHHIVNCRGGSAIRPDLPANPLGDYALDDTYGNNIMITNNSANCRAGHSFIQLSYAAASVVSDNTEDCTERDTGHGNNGDVAKHFSLGYRSTDASFYGYFLTDVTVDNNIFACKPEYGAFGDYANALCYRVRNTNNTWGGYFAYKYRNFTGTGPNIPVWGMCESVEGVTSGNNFNGLDIVFGGADMDATGHIISDNNFAANQNNVVAAQYDLNWYHTSDVKKMGGSIILDHEYNLGGVYQALNDVSITNNRTNGGNITIGFDIDYGPYSRYHNVTVSGNDLVHLKLPQAATWQTQEHGVYGLYSGGRIRFGAIPVDCKVINNSVGAAINNVEGGIQVGFGDNMNVYEPNVATPPHFMTVPYNCVISGNDMRGSVIKTAGWMFNISDNTAVGGIFHNATVYDELVAYTTDGGSTFHNNASLAVGLYHWKLGAKFGIDGPYGNWLDLTEQATDGGSNTQIRNNQFASKKSYSDEDQYHSVPNAMENDAWDSTNSPKDNWGPMIAINRAHNSIIDGNQGVRLIVAQDCQSLRITNNNMTNGREHWNGGHGFTFGYGGHMELFGLMTGAVISGNKLIWERANVPDNTTGDGYDQLFTYNVNQLPLADGNHPSNNSTIPYVGVNKPCLDPFECGFFPERADGVAPAVDNAGQRAADFESAAAWGFEQGLMKGTWMEGWSGSIYYNNGHSHDGDTLPLDIDNLRLTNNSFAGRFWDHSTEDFPDIQNPFVTGNVCFVNKWFEGRLEDYRLLIDSGGKYNERCWFRAFSTGMIYSGNISYASAGIGRQQSDPGGAAVYTDARGAYAVISGNHFKGFEGPWITGGGAVLTGNNYTMYASDANESCFGNEVHGFYTKHDLPGAYVETASRGGPKFGWSCLPPGTTWGWANLSPEAYSGLVLIGELGGQPQFTNSRHWTALDQILPGGSGWGGVPQAERYVAAMGLLSEADASAAGGGYIDTLGNSAGGSHGYHNETKFPVVGPTSHWLDIS